MIEETNSPRNSENPSVKEEASSTEMPEVEGGGGGCASNFETVEDILSATANIDKTLEDSPSSSSSPHKSESNVAQDDLPDVGITQESRHSTKAPLEPDSTSKTRNTHTHINVNL